LPAQGFLACLRTLAQLRLADRSGIAVRAAESAEAPQKAQQCHALARRQRVEGLRRDARADSPQLRQDAPPLGGQGDDAPAGVGSVRREGDEALRAQPVDDPLRRRDVRDG